MGPSRSQHRQDRGHFRRLARGDLSALAAIYDQHAHDLFALALWLTGHRQDAEDLMQGLFVKLARQGPALVAVRRPSAYLQRCLHNMAIDLFRSRRSAGNAVDAPLLEGAAGPESRGDRLDGALRRLPPEQREVVLLHVYLGHTFREVGRITGVSTATAASRYRLAIERLRRELGAGRLEA